MFNLTCNVFSSPCLELQEKESCNDRIYSLLITKTRGQGWGRGSDPVGKKKINS